MIKIVNSYEDANCITHNGTMHADEVFATAFLDLYKGNLKVFRVSEVDWTRVNGNTLVYDVGRREFDHHQPDAIKRENGITYSSIGLLWKKFGKDFLTNSDYDNVELLFEGIDKDLIEAIDADDNGFFPKIEAKYKVKTLSNIIKLFNPGFKSNENESDQFIKAVDIAKQIFYEEIVYMNGRVSADLKIKKQFEDIDSNVEYIILDEYLPYEDTILENEQFNNLKFVAFPSNRGGYAIKTLPKSSNDRSDRLSFPKEWSGLMNKDLEELSGIKDLRFCHTGRFIVTCNTLDAVYEVMKYMCK